MCEAVSAGRRPLLQIIGVPRAAVGSPPHPGRVYSRLLGLQLGWDEATNWESVGVLAYYVRARAK